LPLSVHIIDPSEPDILNMLLVCREESK
jgi:hypothetical protein